MSNIRIDKCTDKDFIKEVVHKCWDSVTDDFSQPKEQWEPDDTLYLEVEVDGTRVGLYSLKAWSPIMAELHAIIMPEFRQKYTYSITRAIHEVLYKHFDIQKFVAMIPSKYPNVLEYALSSGWQEEGVLVQCYKKDNKLWDLHIVGITMDEIGALL